jgi:hypothetical protein
MVPFSGGVIGQKLPLILQILVYIEFSKYSLSGFAILPGLFLKPLGLGAEFNSASDGTIFRRGHRAKTTTSTQNTSVPRGFTRYFLSGFAIQLGLFLKQLGLGAEFNSASNGTIFRRDYRAKTTTYTPNTSSHRVFEVFPVRIRNTTWVTSITTWVR